MMYLRMVREFTTERLALRPLTRADADALHALWTMAGIARFVWDGETIPIEQTRDILERNERLFAESRYGLWGAWDRDRDRLVAFAGLWHFREPPELELIYGVRDDRCRRGYGTEAAAAVLHYAFEQLGMNSVRASTDVPNVASQRVLEKLGFTLLRRANAGGRDTLFYERELGPEESIELPTLAELTTAAKPACVKCGSELVRTDSPASRWTLVIGGGMSAWMLMRGEPDAGVMLLITTVTLAAGVRTRFQFRRCDNCGYEWRR
jgi:ribosomal-protein-alanine N-acetyltransferase